MKKTLLLLLLSAPLLACAANDARVRNFDRNAEDFLFGRKDRVNLTTNELNDLARKQGTLKDSKGKLIPPAQVVKEVPLKNRPGEVPPAPSYRTMADAAKAGLDPLNLVKPMESHAAVPDSGGDRELLVYGGGFGLFLLASVGIFFVSSRGMKKREV